MSIDCRDDELRDLLPELAQGRLDAEREARVTAHVAGCAECAAELAIVRAARASFARAPMVDSARIVAALPRAAARPPLRVERGGAAAPARPRSWISRAGALRIAAGIAAIAIGGAGLRMASDGAPDPVPAIAPSAGAPLPERTASAAAPVGAAPAAGAPESGRGGSAATAQPRAATAAVAAGISFGGGVGDLGDDDLRELLADLERVDAVPSEEPEGELAPVGWEEGR